MVYEFLDNNLESGINEYRVTIELTNGTLVHTNTAQVYFANSLTFVLFPNPLTSPETELNIITDGVNLSIRIYDAAGRILAHTPISGLFFTYKLEGFKQGVLFVYNF